MRANFCQAQTKALELTSVKCNKKQAICAVSLTNSKYIRSGQNTIKIHEMIVWKQKETCTTKLDNKQAKADRRRLKKKSSLITLIRVLSTITSRRRSFQTRNEKKAKVV